MTGGPFRAMRVHACLMAAFAAGFLSCAGQPAHAGEAAFCVTCKGPDQTYLCRVTGEDVSRNDGLKLYCVVRTAKEGGHASCSARNEVAGCNGVERTYSYNGPNIPEDVAEDPRVKKLMERIGGDQKNFRKDDKRKSLVEVTGQAVSASRRGLRNVRTSLGGGGEETNQSAPPSTSVQSGSPRSGLPRSGQLPELPAQSAGPPALERDAGAQHALRDAVAGHHHGTAGA